MKCRHPPSLVEAPAPAEFPGRGTLDEAPDERFIPPYGCATFELVEAPAPAELPGRETLDEAPDDIPDERFIPPLDCAEFESANRRHPEPSEAAGLPVRSLFTLAFALAPRSACCAPEALLNPPEGVRIPGVGLATPFWFVPLENVCPEAAPLRWIDCCICDTCLSNDGGAAAGRDFEKNRCCWLPRCNVDAAAGRLVTDNASRVGTTGRFPAIMRPPRKVSPFTPTGLARPVPNCPVGTVEMPPRTRSFTAAIRKLEYAPPERSGAIPPNPRPGPLWKLLMTVTLVMLTVL